MKKLIGLVAAALMVTSVVGAKPAQAIEKSNRVLLVTSNLTTFGQAKLQWLYQFLDASSVTLARVMMTPHYRQIYAQTGSSATATNYVNSLASLASVAQNKAIDSFIHLHGAPGALWFASGEKSTASLRNNIIAKNIGSKLRLLYSTACFGSSHTQDFVTAGFRAASGARGVNANASFEYPVVMTRLGLGGTFAEAIAAGNDGAARAFHDSLARGQGFTGVDSFKVIRGTSSIRLTSNAD